MPFRTRDFAVFLLLVAFLLSGIAATVHSDLTKTASPQTAAVFETAGAEVVYEAEVGESGVDTRPDRLNSLRAKIAQLVLDEPETTEEQPAVPEALPESVSQSIMLCPAYATSNPAWSPAGIEFEIVEGARLVYRTVVATSTPEGLGEAVAEPTKAVLAQLPLQSFPLTEKTCLRTDVVGIALDGSLLRNSEHTAYQIFGSETRIGYALDGFPIFGTAPASLSLDACGGVAVAGQYGYYLTLERAGILGCFSGEPISL